MRIPFLWLSLLSACTSALDVSSDVVISCQSNSDCPSDLVCAETIDRCVSPDEQTMGLPTFEVERFAVEGSDESVTTAFLRSGRTAVLDLRVQPALGRPPEVGFLDNGVFVPFVVATQMADEGGERYRLTYRASGGEEEAERELRVELVSARGARTEGPLGRSVLFDFSPPSLAESPTPFALLTPNAADNPLRAVEALNGNSELRVTFASQETVESVALTTVPESGLVFRLEVGAGTSFVFELDTRASDYANTADGSYTLLAQLEDRAGNRAEAPLPGVQVDVDLTPPAEPDVDAAGAVTVTRAPWGRDGAPPSLRVSGESGSVEGGATVIVFADRAGAIEIARCASEASGAFGLDTPCALPVADRRDVYLRVVDSAGNISGVDATRVRDGVWVAKLGGDVEPNPHRLTGIGYFSNNRAPGGRIVLDDDSLLDASDGARFVTSAAPVWFDLTARRDGEVGDFKWQAQSLYDPVQGVTLRLGDLRSNATAVPMSSRSGTAWRSLSDFDPEGDGSPGPLGTAGFEPGLGAVMLYDGRSMWSWSGSSWERRPLGDPEGDGNPALPFDSYLPLTYSRQLNALAFYSRDPWVWTGNSWLEVCTEAPCAATKPIFDREYFAYEDAAGRLAVVGDRDDSACAFEVWTFDGGTFEETVPCVDGAPSGTRFYATFAYDPERDALVVHGSNTLVPRNVLSADPQVRFFDTWELRDGRWSCLSDAALCNQQEIFASEDPCFSNRSESLTLPDEHPGSGCHGSMSYDPRRAAVVLTRLDGASFEWDGASWSSYEPGPEPGPRLNPVMAHDRSVGAVTLAAGTASSIDISGTERDTCAGGCAYSDQWRWNGKQWVQICGPGLTSCDYVPRNGAVTIETDDGVLMFGGNTGSGTIPALTEEGKGGVWNVRCNGSPDSCTNEVAVSTAAFASQQGRGWYVLGIDSGFNASASLVEWTGADWVNTGFDIDGFGSRPAMGAIGSKLVLFSSASRSIQLDDPSPAWTPFRSPVRFGAAMAFDEASSQLFAYGGEPNGNIADGDLRCEGTNTSACTTLFRWDGAQLSEVATADPYRLGGAPARWGHRLAYDPLSGRLLMAAGTSGPFDARPDENPQTWELDVAGATPAHIAEVDTVSVGLDEDLESLSLAVHWSGRGVGGDTAGLSQGGAQLWLWDQSQWVPLDAPVEHDAAPDVNVATLREFVSTDLQRVITTEGQRAIFAIATRAPSGATGDPARIETDALEFEWRYRLAE